MQVQKVIRNKLVSTLGFTLTEVLVVLCLFALLSGFFLNCFVFAM
ncbi:MAG: prepilin-type N-terminal cleavage/methylation domain-containing protein, partial [Peptococcaceae bacterium]|nr:prepilin-type N-terminal cleavage/methylation domain-containing protein [Peptococcaceae bacterium]